MASQYLVEDAFRTLGSLWGSEQADGDDEGVAKVEDLTAKLRDFKQHNDETPENSDECGCCLPCCC